MQKSKLSVYSYGINHFSYCFNVKKNQIEPYLLIMNYGKGKLFVFPKDKAFDLLFAIYDEKSKEYLKYKPENVEAWLKFEGNDICKILNSRLSGKGFAMITKFKQPVEYINGIQNSFVGITGFDLEGNLIAKTKKELFSYGFVDIRTDDYREATVEDLGNQKKDQDSKKIITFDA